MMNCNSLAEQQLVQPEVIKASKQFHKCVERVSLIPLSTSPERFLEEPAAQAYAGESFDG